MRRFKSKSILILLVAVIAASVLLTGCGAWGASADESEVTPALLNSPQNNDPPAEVSYVISFVTGTSETFPAIETRILLQSQIPTPDAKNKPGYTFEGWYLTSDYAGSKIIAGYEFTRNTTLYAKWIANTTIRITTAEELADIAQKPSGNYALGADIDLSQIESWEPIGGFEEGNEFSGTFDGNGYVISGMTIKGLEADEEFNYLPIGLFGKVTGTIRNVCIGDRCRIDGASRLDNGTVNSNAEAPVYIGPNVTAEDFIISSGAYVSDGVVMSRCFIGQACHLAHLFSAHDSLFFSNCQGENGEACAILAGPYTVTMHKSSLLIAGMFSFLNAGSGSNQSNHMYKLGPIHQGVVERGSKTTSDSYILWPAKIGAFSLIMGRHVNHPDTSGMPFSYLIEHGSKSYLVPGANLKSVGTIRDAQKWPRRDKRKDPNKLDCINFNLLSPYTIQKMLQGINTLQGLKKTSGETSETYSFQSTTIKNHSLEKGINLYTLAVHKFMGNSIIKRLEGGAFADIDDLHRRMKPTDCLGQGEWIDLLGLIVPKQAVSNEIDHIVSTPGYTLEETEAFFRDMHKRYYDMEWTWVCDVMPRWYGKTYEQLTPEDIIGIVKKWNESVVALDRMLYDDARKEFSMVSRIGFGVDGSTEQRDFDFEQVRGEFESDAFVKMVCKHIEDKTALGNELIERLKSLADRM